MRRVHARFALAEIWPDTSLLADDNFSACEKCAIAPSSSPRFDARMPRKLAVAAARSGN
jgi:hypothetical protein